MTATITLSLEVELAWGVHGVRPPETMLASFSEGRQMETATMNNLLDVSAAYDIPITFDVVGHLLLDRCGGHHEGPYSDDWFLGDPGTSVNTDPLFYAPDLVDSIIRSSVQHEIATHSFSHVAFEAIPVEVAEREFQLVQDVHSEFGLDAPKTLVAPYHQTVPRDVVTDYGIQSIRIPLDEARKSRYPFTSLDVLRRTHPFKEPEVVDGVVESYTSPWPSLSTPLLPNGQNPVSPPLSLLPVCLRQAFHRRYLDAALDMAVEDDLNLHLWTHLFNISNQYQWPTVRWFLEKVGTLARENIVSFETIGDQRG